MDLEAARWLKEAWDTEDTPVDKSSLPMEVEVGCVRAGLPVRQELPECQCEDEETYEMCCQSQNETAAVSDPLRINLDLKFKGEGLELCSSEHSEELQGKPSKYDGNIIFIDTLDKEAISEEDYSNQHKNSGTSFQDLTRHPEHKQNYFGEHSYHCPVCSKEFFRAANLRMHRLIHSSDRPHKCPGCDKGFIRTADVWRHLRNVHKLERSRMAAGTGTVRNPWSTTQRNNLSSDDLDPGKKDSKPYVCPICCKGFHKANLLSKHKVIHRQDKPYKCQECGMAFVQLLRLKRHQQTHSGERPFYCDECGGTFTRQASLQRHQRVHTGEKPYSCAYCGHSFTESGTLRRHERTHKVEES